MEQWSEGTLYNKENKPLRSFCIHGKVKDLKQAVLEYIFEIYRKDGIKNPNNLVKRNWSKIRTNMYEIVLFTSEKKDNFSNFYLYVSL